MSDKVWEMDSNDVVRFVLRRKEWELLIKALAAAAVWAGGDDHDLPWEAMDVLREAEVDIDASNMVRALDKIANITKNHKTSEQQIIHMWATRPQRMKTEAEQAEELAKATP